MTDVIPGTPGPKSSTSGLRPGQTLSATELNYAPLKHSDAVLLTNFPVSTIAQILRYFWNVRNGEVIIPKRVPPLYPNASA